VTYGLESLALAAAGSPTAAASAASVDPNELVAGLFRSEGASLVRLARLFTDDRAAAEDLVQEAFVRLHRSAHRIREPDRAAPYLRSIVLNLARDHNRRGLMSLRHYEAITPEAGPDAPEDRILVDAEQARVIEALRSLSPRQRDCLVLRFYLRAVGPGDRRDPRDLGRLGEDAHAPRDGRAPRDARGGAVNPEDRLGDALHRIDAYDPSPDLFARVRRSIEEDAAHRSRLRWAIGALLVGSAALAAWFSLTSEVADGRVLAPWWAVEAAESAVLVAIVVVLGPMIRRFGKTYAGEVFRANPPTGDRFLVLFDIAYYLIFSGYVLVTASFEPGGTRELAPLLEDAAVRVGGILLLMGVLHSVSLAALPVIGLLFSSTWRRAIRAQLGDRVPPPDPRAQTADRVAAAIVWVGAGVVVLGALFLAVAVVLRIGFD
jgi:RNA polymerase sigma factor (sigma-70 family)